MTEKDIVPFRFDSTFKAMVDDQTIAMLSFLFGRMILKALELKEELFKQDTIQPALRVDCAYMITLRTRKGEQEYVGHVEFEVTPPLTIDARLLEYFGLLYNKYRRAILQVLVCPFETPNLPTLPLRIEVDEEMVLEHRYRVLALWLHPAQELVEQRQVEIYALLPTMKGASSELLLQAIREMQVYYAGQESRFRLHLLWFDAFLSRTKTVSVEDKRRVREVMNDFRSLLDDSYFVQQRAAESRQEGLTEGLEKGLAEGLEKGLAEGHEKGLTEGLEKGREEGLEKGLSEGLQEAVLVAVEVRFPALIDLAEERVRHIKQADRLRLLAKGIKTASDENAARFLLDLLAA